MKWLDGKKAATLALGILTSVGGFFDAGNIATSAQAGAVFRYQLLWSLLLGTLLVIFLVEMSGRFSAVTHKAIAGRHPHPVRLPASGSGRSSSPLARPLPGARRGGSSAASASPST